MEPCKIRRTTEPNSSPYARGLEGKKMSLLPVEGEKLSLTSPLIDQALALKTRRLGSMSAKAIFQQLRFSCQVRAAVK